MNRPSMVVAGRNWLPDVAERGKSEGAIARSNALDIFFYHPDDHDQWVSNCLVPADEADLSEVGLYRLFREADERSWRDAAGTYWRIRITRAGSLGPPGELLPDGIVYFYPRKGSNTTPLRKIVAELPPIGRLTDAQIERLKAKSRPAARH